MPSLQVPSAPTPSALSKFTTRDKLLLAQAVHELGGEPPEWGKVASLMLAHPVVRDPTRLEEVQAAGITIGRVFGTRECERAWTALMRQRGLVLQPGEVGTTTRNPIIEARNRKEARGAPPRTDKKSQLALAQLLYAERMEEIKESLRGKEIQNKNLLAYISQLQSGALDEVLAEELKAEALGCHTRGEGRGERTRSGASSTFSTGLNKRGSNSNNFDVDFNESYGSQEGGSSSQDSSITNTGRKRRAAAIVANANSAPGTPLAGSGNQNQNSNDKEKEKDVISPSRLSRKDRIENRNHSNSNSVKIEKEINSENQEVGNDEETQNPTSNHKGSGNKRKRGGGGGGGNKIVDQEEETDQKYDEIKETEGSSSKKAKKSEEEEEEEEERHQQQQDEEMEGDEPEPLTRKTRSTRSSARGGSVKQDQELNEEDQDSRMSRNSLSPDSSRGGGGGGGNSTKDSNNNTNSNNTRTSSRLRRDSSAAGTGNVTRNRGMSNSSTTSSLNLNSKSENGNNVLSPTNTRSTRANNTTTTGSSSSSSKDGKNSTSNHDNNRDNKVKEKEKTEDRKRKEKVLLLLWQEVAGHRNANLFQDSVKEGDAPDYYSLIRHPIDLKQIKASIKSGNISSITQLKRSLNQMFANALVYNREGTDVHRLAEEMRKDVEEIWKIMRNDSFGFERDDVKKAI